MSFDDLFRTLAAIVVAVFHTAGFLFALRAILISRTPQAAIAWSFALVVMPYLAIPLFLVFGESIFAGYVLAGGGERPALDAAMQDVRSVLEPFRADFDEKHADASKLAERLCRLPPTGGNSVRLLIDGEETFDAVLEAIDGARCFLLVQFFIVRDDRIGRAMQERLLAALGRGVRVWFLYDQVGSRALPARFKNRLREAGAELHGFVTNRQLGKRFRINFRNHRKLVIADGRLGFIGGSNVGDEYMGRSKRFGPWRDTFLRIEGPAVRALQIPFLEDWNFATRAVLDLPRSAPPRHAGAMRVFTIPSSPVEVWSVCPAAYIEVIHDVRERLWIASPYFVPDFALLTAIGHAALRGVDVRILLPAKPDHLLPWLSSYSFYPSMHAAGVRIFRYQAGFMHQKVLLADNDLAIVGSINTDFRSFMLNFELSAAINDRAFAGDVERMLAADFSRAREEDLTMYKAGSLFFRLKVRLAALLSPQQ